MSVINRPWLYRDDDGRPGFRTSWHDESRAPQPYWPGPSTRKEQEAHDRQTRALIERFDELHRLPHGEEVADLLEEWAWKDKMESPAVKQHFLEPIIVAVQRAPERNESKLIFLLLVCEGIRRSVARELCGARFGLDGNTAAPDRHRREEARRINEIERERLHGVTQQAVLEALYRCPSPMPERFFGWLRETVAHRTLDFLRGELGSLDPCSTTEEAEALQAYISGLDHCEAPQLGEKRGFTSWRLRARGLYEPVDSYYRLGQVRTVCRNAVDRLPRRQREVIDSHFLEGQTPDEIATELGVSRSTVYNHKAQALSNLYEDDVFFVALCGMQMVRDAARRSELTQRYPEDRMPDGRRIVHINEAA